MRLLCHPRRPCASAQSGIERQPRLGRGRSEAAFSLPSHGIGVRTGSRPKESRARAAARVLNLCAGGIGDVAQAQLVAVVGWGCRGASAAASPRRGAWACPRLRRRVAVKVAEHPIRPNRRRKRAGLIVGDQRCERARLPRRIDELEVEGQVHLRPFPAVIARAVDRAAGRSRRPAGVRPVPWRHNYRRLRACRRRSRAPRAGLLNGAGARGTYRPSLADRWVGADCPRSLPP